MGDSAVKFIRTFPQQSINWEDQQLNLWNYHWHETSEETGQLRTI